MIQTDIEEYIARLAFGGVTYDPDLDRKRLGDQMIRILDCMLDGKWRTLREISDMTDDPEASVSARLRDVRKLWGEGAMEARRTPSVDGRRGLWQYRVRVAKVPASANENGLEL